ncbi:hypothetical protein [Acinetobacter radioresistens]|uniref:hypothetical protein n=1 Tax=Acinetobacter radioresistens TaxID=40216 RepID=UPI00094667E1|nr:hypothetical protein [Acinetobacter radioresistens]
MTFQSILENFKAASNGTDAFKQLKVLCQQSISNVNNNLDSSALFLIYGFAKNYVLLYEDQEVNPEFAKKAKNQLISYMSELNTALITQDSHLVLKALNNVAEQYFRSSKIF